MFDRLRFLTAGESHGPKLTAILEGMPAGLVVDIAAVNYDLARRQKGFGRGGRMKIEQDTMVITSGVTNHQTTGGPIALEIDNVDYKNWKSKDVDPMVIPRPGHADLTGALKYRHEDLRLSLERASARETAARVAVGGLCKQLLSQFDIKIGGYTTRIGLVDMKAAEAIEASEYRKRFETALTNEFALHDASFEANAREHIHECMRQKDTLGGIFEVVALNCPPGLGSFVHWDRRLDAQIAAAMLSIQAMKGVEIGPAFDNASLRGTRVQDEILVDDQGNLTRQTNRCGGLEGGITNGMPLVVRVAMKPISTTLTARRSVDLSTGLAHETKYERSDFCALPRAVPIGEAMLAFVLANALLEKLGGDSIKEMKPRFDTLTQNDLKQIHLRNEPWRFEYGV